jgi:hypothetical protein
MLRDILRPRTLALYYVMVALAGGAFASPGNGGMAATAPFGGPPTPKPPPSALLPAKVGDLRASAVTDSAVVLTWTEVSSSTSGTARYVVRFGQAATYDWASRPDVLTGGCGAPVYGSTAAGGRVRSCVLSGLGPNLAYSFQVVAYTGTLGTATNISAPSNVVTVTTAQRVGPMLVLRPRMFVDTLAVAEASLPYDFGPRRYPLRGKFPAGDRVVSFYDSTGALTAFGYLLIVKAP